MGGVDVDFAVSAIGVLTGGAEDSLVYEVVGR